MNTRAITAALAVAAILTGCGDKNAKDKPAPSADTSAVAADTVAATPDTDTATTFTDTRDGKVYKKVVIGAAVWMAENLNYAAEGSKCYGEGGEAYVYNEATDSWGWKTLSDLEAQANCDKYGRLYNWSTAMAIDTGYNSSQWDGSDVNHQGVCPDGWHIPSENEWTKLVEYAGSGAGTKLKSASGWIRDGNGTDKFGFAALPGGNSGGDGTFDDAGGGGNWWSATKGSADYALRQSMYCNGEGVYWKYTRKAYLFSVRCVQAAIRDTSTLTDKRDGKVYKTVKIGRQSWFAENLNYAADGSACYDNKAENCVKYGRLYNWETAVKACPAGYHLPSHNEWARLVDYVGGDSTAGKVLKSLEAWYYEYRNDDYGFAALPGGFGSRDSSFDFLNNNGYWWSATEYNTDMAWYRTIDYLGKGVDEKIGNKANLLSVRCVKDD